ncbi:class I SAM-dependent methyltransferase [Propionivibrio limicola]|uniref:class I SAM-dependent methyltransferase n=1 Tax=Propionivibrio limicola TaxID=167645 RepID=UPI001291E2FA|nr:class I SAM-dependent methyltransferase [Propionivibrio limicola]
MTDDSSKSTTWDHSSDQNFVDYYAQQSLAPQTIQRFTLVRDKSLRLLAKLNGGVASQLNVADIGCGTGMQAQLWAQRGHKVFGLDVNAPLIEIARHRAEDASLAIQFDVGSATELPYPDTSMDVALLPELLEHVADWQGCLNEATRILKPGGLLYLSTTNWLCPIQQEYSLPLYSWYPGFLKRRYERLAVTTRPEIANYCKYPAVNWFSFYSLSAYLRERGFHSLDRFDMIETEGRGIPVRVALSLFKAIPPLRFIGQVLTSGSIVFAIKYRVG